MQRTIKALAFTLLALSAQHLTAQTNKTFLSTRPQGVDSLLERVMLQSMTASKDEDAFGGIFQATAFYNEAIQTSGLSRYFLFGDKDSAALTRANLQLLIPDQNSAANIDNIVAAGGPATPLYNKEITTVKFSPTLRSFGVFLTYYQDLEKILPGLYFNVRVPVVEVESDLGLIATGGNSEAVKQFLSGTLNEIPVTASYARKPLQHAKISTKQQNLGIADIDLRMGYAFLQGDEGSLGLNIGLTVPTGNIPEAKQAFEAIYGNNGHWGFGAGLEGRYRLWESDESNLVVHASTDYRNLFANTERRTFGIKGIDFGQYRIVAERTNTSANLQAIPAAEALTLSTDVTPGMQLDNSAGFTYSYGGLTLDLAYNLWYRDRESLKLRDAWNDTKYAYLSDGTVDTRFGLQPVAPAGAGADRNFRVADANHANLTHDAIDFEAARTAVQLTNKILAGVGYVFKEFEYPIMLGIGGHYEIPNDNNTARTWGFFCKTGIAF